MSAYTRWRQVGLVDAPMVKWETEGQTLEGIFRGSKPSTKYEGSNLGIMEHEDGTGSVFPITAALERDLALVPVGARLRIVYVGMKKSRTGRMFRAFQVFVEDGPADEGHAPQPAPKMKGKKLSSRNEPWPPPDTEDGDVVPF